MITSKNTIIPYWCYTKTGLRHLATGEDNQDYIYVNSNDRIKFVAVADGVSSCENGRQGAELACKVIFEALKKEVDYLLSLSKKSIAYLIVNLVQSKVDKLARKTGRDIFSFASTLSFVCVDCKTDRAISFSVGDSDIFAVTNDDQIKRMSEARKFESGMCCATLTKEAYLYASVEIFDPFLIRLLFIGSDGAWNVMLKNDVMDSNVVDCLMNNDYKALSDILNDANNLDDCSFVCMNLAA